MNPGLSPVAIESPAEFARPSAREISGMDVVPTAERWRIVGERCNIISRPAAQRFFLPA